MPDIHINDEQFDLYATGRLPEESLAWFEEHLLICQPCQARQAEADEFVALLRTAIVSPEARPQVRRWALWRPRITAGFAAAAAFGAVLFVVAQRPRQVGEPMVVRMESMRGPEAPAHIEAGKPAILALDIDVAGGAEAYTAKIVDLAGAEIAKPRTGARDGRLALTVERLPQGSYWLRIYRQGAEPIAEYGLQAK